METRLCSVARVRLLDTLYHIDKLYDYHIPPALRDEVVVGGFVVVPFGKTTRRFIALVVELADGSEHEKLKPIMARINPSLVLSDEQMRLCAFIKEHTFCTMGDAVRAMLPSGAFAALMMSYTPHPYPPAAISSLPTDRMTVYNYIANLKTVSESRLVQKFGKNVAFTLKEMVQDGFLLEAPSGMGTEEKTQASYRLSISEQEVAKMLEENKPRGVKQRLALQLLLEQGVLNASELRQNGISAQTCHLLVQAGLVCAEQSAQIRDPFADLDRMETPKEHPMTKDQAEAFDQIKALLDTGKPQAALLHGVTGSGKTRVMKAVIDEVISRGKSVILLVPEIALTPQTVGYFRSFYGQRTAVIHSMLSAGEKYDAWRRMRDGQIDLCIGTRSAVFAPLPNLGAILIDEEQEHTYKSDSAPKYHAIDVARFRCAYHNALMLPASATPSLESYHKAVQGIYTLISLPNRIGAATLPTVCLADLRNEVKKGDLSPIGSELKERLERTLEQGEQAILFINRRGYHHFLTCPICGSVVSCPRCSVSLTHHQIKGSDVGVLRCHYCNHTEAKPTVCPSCKQKGLRQVGFGTQKAQEALEAMFPNARILRMDADTTQGKQSYRRILDAFRRKEADILIGTQMVTKGHDFPSVTTVGVLNADGSLYLDDFRASERTFSLLTQVVGRAGRSDLAGMAMIQTMSPHHPMLELIKSQDYATFYQQEIALRRALSFPPFCDLVSVTLSGKEENEVLRTASAFYEELCRLQKESPEVAMQVFGPMEAPVYRLNEVYRMRLVIKCVLNSATRALISQLYQSCSYTFARRVTISIDPNPSSM